MLELTKGTYRIVLNDVNDRFLELKNPQTGWTHTLLVNPELTQEQLRKFIWDVLYMKNLGDKEGKE